MTEERKNRRKQSEGEILRVPEEFAACMDERLRPVLRSWQKFGGFDLVELVRSAYAQGLMDGASPALAEALERQKTNG